MACICEHVHEGRLQRNMTACRIGQLPPASEHLIPNLHAFRVTQIEMRDGVKKTLEELSARRKIKTFERIRKQLEIRILDGRARGRRGAGAGHDRYNLTSAYPRGVWG